MGDANFNLRPNLNPRLSSIDFQRVPNFENLGGFSAREGFRSLNYNNSQNYSQRFGIHDRSQDFRPIHFDFEPHNNFNANPRIPQVDYVWPQIPPPRVDLRAQDFHAPRLPPYVPRDEEEPRPENDFDRQRRISSAFETMRKWNLKFSGAHGEDPVEFLRSINEGRGLLRVNDQ